MLTTITSEVQVKGNTRQSRYKGWVDFEFEKPVMTAMDLASAKKHIGGILLPESQVAASQTKTIELDQTIAQVEATFGKPLTIVKLGARTIYTYKDIKVTFTDGKVSDVQ